MEANEKILHTSLQMFFRYGIKHVTMDDIAKELGMSIKTIYLYFKEIDDLVNQLCSGQVKIQENGFAELIKIAKDPIHEIILMSEKMREMMQNINPLFFLDLQKFYPLAYEEFQRFKQSWAYMSIVDNLNKGIEEGLYREDLDVNFTAKYRLAQIDLLMFGNYFTYEKLSLGQSSQYLIELFVYGISTQKGHKLLDQYKKTNNKE